VANLNGVISRNRENSEAWLLRGLSWNNAGDFDRALADLNIACRLKSTDYRPWMERGRVLLQMRRVDDAISDLSSAVQLGATVAECHYQLAMAFIAQSNLTAARANLDQALSLEAGHGPSRLARARLWSGDGEYQKALQDLALVPVSACGDNGQPLLPAVHFERSRALHATGSDNDALLLLASVLNSNPSNAEALQLRAAILHKLNRPEEAVADYTQLISLETRSEPYLIERAKLHIEAERWNDALQDVSRALETEADSVEGLTIRATIHQHLEQHSLAVADLTAAMKLEPQRIELLRQRSAVFTALGEDIAALSDLQRITELDPSDEATVRMVADKFLEQQNVPGAITVLNRVKAARRDDFPSSLNLMLSQLKVETGDVDGAQQALDSLNFADSTSIDAEILRARIALAREDYPAALVALNRISGDGLTSHVHLLRGIALNKLGKIPEAEAELSKCLILSPDDATALELRATVYESLQDWSLALADANAVLETQPDSAAMRRVRGVSLFQQRHFRDAIDDLDSLEVRKQDTPELQWIRIQCLLELDQKFRAREELNVLIETDPAHLQARSQRAKLAEEQGELETALADLSAIIVRQPESPEAILHRGLLQHRRGQYSAAVDDFTEVLTITPDADDIYYRRGLARHQLQQTEQAVADLDECLKRNPKHAEAFYVKGNIAAAAGDAVKALELYEAAVKITPTHSAAWYNRGNLLFNESRLDDAVESWTKSLEVQPNLFRAYNNRAAALVKLERFKEAVQDYERALEISPGFARAWDNYAWLLATSDDPEIRDTTRAVFMAKKACELTGYKDWAPISTLAAAYAEAGDLDQAASWAREAKAVAPADQQEEIEELAKTYEKSRRTQKNSSTAVRDGQIRR
jgi:tetratricopeptide (TPR) repeat protein